MKISSFRLFSCLTFILAALAFYFSWTFHVVPQVLVTPIVRSEKLKMADNFWVPKAAQAENQADNLADLTAEAAFFVETGSGQVLFEKNSREKLPIASLTKIMTVIIALEKLKMEDKIHISANAAETEPDKMYLKGGETLSVEELLEGIFLVSANDAAEALAERTTGRREEFIELMNSKAKNIGMNDTLFVNPTGLMEENKRQYSTAFDVSLMAYYAIHTYPYLTEISRQLQIYIPESETHQEYNLFNGINLLSTYPGVVGFKTGYTPEAGLTLVTVARLEGKEVIGVLLGCTNRRDDAKRVLDYSFNKLGVKVQ